MQAEPVYTTLRQRGIRTAKLFWWFNQRRGRSRGYAETVLWRRWSKAFDIQSYPNWWETRLTEKLGDFPFPNFWGPMAGLPCTQWIAQCAAEVLNYDGGPPNLSEAGPPHLTLVYLPHLDYEPQRVGPNACDWKKIVYELDEACSLILEGARKTGAAVWVVNEYTHTSVDQPIMINQALRRLGLLAVRDGPFGEQLDPYASRAFAVCDHQVAHVYVNYPVMHQVVPDRTPAPHVAPEFVKQFLMEWPGVDRVYAGDERAEIGLNHPRAGDLVVLAKPNAWFAYPFWLDDRKAPDYARTATFIASQVTTRASYFSIQLLAKARLIKVLMKKMGLHARGRDPLTRAW